MMVELKNSSEFSPAMVSKRGAALDPVVALVAEQEVAAVAAEDEVVAGAAEGFLAVRAGDDEVLALVAEDQRQAASRHG